MCGVVTRGWWRRMVWGVRSEVWGVRRGEGLREGGRKEGLDEVMVVWLPCRVKSR